MSESTSVRATGVPADTRAAVRYNQVQQLSSHNSYNNNGPKDDIETQLRLGIRSFELDLHASNPGNWNIYHASPPADFVGDLHDALMRFSTFHNANPNHEVITIWLELKNEWSLDGHMPGDLDELVGAGLPNLIYTPSDLLGAAQGAANLRDAIANTGWPEVEQMRGKVLLVLMGNDRATVQYLANRAHTGNCFVAPEDDLSKKLAPNPDGAWIDSIFFNCHNTDGLDVPTRIFQLGLISRIWRIDNQKEYNLAIGSMAHHIATDHVTRNLFVPVLTNANGRPFRPFGE